MKTSKLVHHVLIVAILCFTAGTATAMGAKPPPEPKPVALVPIWETKHPDGKKWTSHVMNRLDTLGGGLIDTIPADIATFCPAYGRLSDARRKEFWTYFLSAMVRYESNFDASAKYQENFRDANGNFVISRGLLQISIESSQPYDCGFRQAEQLHDPLQNLSCGIKILNRWVANDQRVAGKVGTSWKGGARYWAVLRSTTSPYNSIVSLTKTLPLCQ